MNPLLDLLGSGVDLVRSRRFPAALAVAGIVGLFLAALFMFPSFDSYSDISELTLFGAFVGFVAAGETLVILIGGVDLSAPWIMTTGGILVAGWATAQHVPTVVAIVGALAVAGCVGAVNGIIVAWLGLSPVIVTLATNGLVEGGLLAYERGMSPLNVPTPITHWVYTKVWGLSSAGIFWIVASIILAVLLRRSTPGFRHLATGGNRIAAVLSGVPTRLVTVGAYCGCSVLCALAGILYSGFVQIPYYGMGDPFLFEAVAGAVIGGLAFTGGEGSFVGTLIGVLFIVTLNQFMSALNVSAGVVDLIYGAAILFALAVSGPGSAQRALARRPARRPAARRCWDRAVTGTLDSLPMIGPARRRVLSDEVADAIRDAIFDGRIDLGQRLVEDELASTLNVSRGPVRRALVLLSQEGLVNTEHHRGTTVAQLSADDVRETASLRTALERLAVDWLCRNATGADFTRIAAVLQQVGDLAEAEPLSPSRVAALDVAFHDAVFRAAHHERLYRSWRSLRSQIYIDLVYRRALRDDVGQWVTDHQKFLEVLRGRNHREVTEMVAAHVEGPHGPTGASSSA